MTGRAETERILDAFIARLGRVDSPEAMELARAQTLSEFEAVEPWQASEDLRNAIVKAETEIDTLAAHAPRELIAWLRAGVYGLAALCELIEGRTR